MYSSRIGSSISHISSTNLFSANNEPDLSQPDIDALVKCGIEVKNKIATGLNGPPNNAIHERLNKIAEYVYDIVKDKNQNQRDKHILLNRCRNEIIRLCIDQKACHSVNIQDITDFIKICTLLPDHSDYEPQTKWFNFCCCKDLDPHLQQLISKDANISIAIDEQIPNISSYLKDVYPSDYGDLRELIKANLTDANLSDYSKNFKDFFVFINCNFTNAKFERSSLNQKRFELSNMTNCSFEQATLNKINFTSCIFNNTNFRDAILDGCELDKVATDNIEQETHVIFTNAELRSTNILGKWSQADFREAHFKSSNLIGVVCNDADFRGAIFKNSTIRYGDFSQARFDYAQLIDISLRGANFTGTNFDGVTEFTLKISNNLDVEFNHINNPSGSILTAINSIDSRYQDLKNNLMIQVFEFLAQKNIESIVGSLVDILFNQDNEEYYAHAFSKVPKFGKTIFSIRCEQGAIGALPMSEREIKFHLNHIMLYQRYNKAFFKGEYNGFFIQLIHQAHQAKEIAHLKEQADQLYTDYLETIGFFEAQTEDDELITSVIDTTYGTERAIDNAGIILLANYKDIIIVDNSYFHNALYEETLPSSFNWNNLTYFQCTRIKAPENPNAIIYKNVPVTSLDDIGAFRIFLARFTFEREKNKFNNLIKLLDLGEYEESFLKAVGSNTSTTKYTEFIHQDKLAVIFQNLFGDTKDILGIKVDTLKIQHIDKILEIYGFDKKTANEQAKLLLLLSGIFIKYSSSRIFGIEDNSPYVLRRYAAGLLASAVQKDKNIATAAQLQDWINRMLGLGGAFQCTAVLSDIIIEYCKKFPEYLKLLGGIIPSAWI